VAVAELPRRRLPARVAPTAARDAPPSPGAVTASSLRPAIEGEPVREDAIFGYFGMAVERTALEVAYSQLRVWQVR